MSSNELRVNVGMNYHYFQRSRASSPIWRRQTFLLAVSADCIILVVSFVSFCFILHCSFTNKIFEEISVLSFPVMVVVI